MHFLYIMRQRMVKVHSGQLVLVVKVKWLLLSTEKLKTDN